MKSQQDTQLSNANITFISWMVVGLLVLWGPVNPPDLLIRSTYLIAIPLTVWLLLKVFQKYRSVRRDVNGNLTSTLLGLLSGLFIALAYSDLTSEYHTVCDHYIRTRDGRECVGDYVTVAGPDRGSAFFWTLIGGAAFWFGVIRGTDRLDVDDDSPPKSMIERALESIRQEENKD